MYTMRNKFIYDYDDDHHHHHHHVDVKNLFKKCNSQARLGVAIFSPFLQNELVM